MSSKIKGTYKLSKAGFETTEIRDLVLRRRLQILVHSCIYYHFNTTVISDQQWDKWATELVQLQNKYPKLVSHIDYHKEFSSFDGTTGFDLPLTNPEVLRKASQLLRFSNSKSKKKSNKSKKVYE